MKRYAVCITDDDGGTGEAVFTVKNKTEARAGIHGKDTKPGAGTAGR